MQVYALQMKKSISHSMTLRFEVPVYTALLLNRPITLTRFLRGPGLNLVMSKFLTFL